MRLWGEALGSTFEVTNIAITAPMMSHIQINLAIEQYIKHKTSIELNLDTKLKFYKMITAFIGLIDCLFCSFVNMG